MKRISAFLLVLCLLAVPIFSNAESIDLSGMTFAELVKLQERVTMAMWKSDDWQEVTVPAGLYTVGVEIPAGKWTVTATPNAYSADVTIGTELNETKSAISFMGERKNYSLYGVDNWAYNESRANSCTVTLKEGMYISIGATVVFTPYAGPGFSFK